MYAKMMIVPLLVDKDPTMGSKVLDVLPGNLSYQARGKIAKYMGAIMVVLIVLIVNGKVIPLILFGYGFIIPE